MRKTSNPKRKSILYKVLLGFSIALGILLIVNIWTLYTLLNKQTEIKSGIEKPISIEHNINTIIQDNTALIDENLDIEHIIQNQENNASNNTQIQDETLEQIDVFKIAQKELGDITKSCYQVVPKILNVRKTQSPKSEVIKKIHKNEVYCGYEIDQNGRTLLKTDAGYIDTQYLKKID